MNYLYDLDPAIAGACSVMVSGAVISTVSWLRDYIYRRHRQ